MSLRVFFLATGLSACCVLAFNPSIPFGNNNFVISRYDTDINRQFFDPSRKFSCRLQPTTINNIQKPLLATSADDLELERVPTSLENVPLPFIDPESNSFIECFADSIVTLDGTTYTIAVPCDYSVALCYFDDSENLVPIELDDPLMDDVFPVAEAIVAEEFEEELVLQRTPQTLTLVGELDITDEEDEDDDDDDADDEEEDDDEDEEVEVLLSFEHREQEYSLVRLLDPILLVGKENPDDTNSGNEEGAGGTRLLLSPEESETVMPILEELFLKYHDNSGTWAP
jgi:Protein of unknown function (DUF3727)